ncbi:MAG: hypothetical protein V7642_4648 [Burkholderiales bacterium]|jgi:hypothetical protein
MKVDHYRSLRVPEYSFVVPAGTDLNSYSGQEREYIEAFLPFEPVELDFELEAIVTGGDLAKLIDDLQRAGLSMMKSRVVTDTVEVNDDGID